MGTPVRFQAVDDSPLRVGFDSSGAIAGIFDTRGNRVSLGDLTTEEAENLRSSGLLDGDTVLHAVVVPRSGTKDVLKGLAGREGELSYPTDYPRSRILHTGAAGGAVHIGFAVVDEVEGFVLGPTATNPVPDSNVFVGGNSASAQGESAFALGNGANATDGGVCAGNSATAAMLATAIGNEANATGNETVAIGLGAQATGNCATAVGMGAISVENGTAIGHSAIAGASSVCVGKGATSEDADSAVVIGENSMASASGVVLIGPSLYTNAAGMVMVGKFQLTSQYARATTANATPVLLTDISGGDTFARVPRNEVTVLDVTVRARTTDSAAVFAARRRYVLRSTSAGVVSIAHTETIGADYVDTALSGISFAAGTGTDLLTFTLTGKAATNVVWSVIARGI